MLSGICIPWRNKMTRLLLLLATVLMLPPSVALGQDAMKYGLKHLKVRAEDEKVRVLEYMPVKGDKTPIHSHPATVVYVVRGGRVRYTMPDGSIRAVELKTGDVVAPTGDACR